MQISYLYSFWLVPAWSCIAIPWPGPTATEYVASRVATHRTVPTPALFKRENDYAQYQNNNTCGYIDQDIARPLTCQVTGRVCATQTAAKRFQCCETDGNNLKCAFFDGCEPFKSGQSSKSLSGSTSTVLTCSSDFPACQTTTLYASFVPYTQYRCGSLTTKITATDLGLISNPPFSSPAFIIASVVPAFTIEPVVTPGPPSSVPSRRGLSIEVSVGIILVVAAVVLALSILTFISLRIKGLLHQKSKIVLKFLGRNAPADETPSHDKAADECLPEVDTRGFDVTKSRELDFLNDHRYPADFVKFLSMFGHEGVVIKEFLMFASLRYPQNDQESGNNDLEASGNPVQKMPEQEESFVTSLVQSIRCREDVDAVRSALVHSIDVIGKQPGHHPGWMVDCQVWVAKSTADHFVPGHIDEKDVQELLRIFGKPTHVGPACVRNRLCEIWYPFARTVCHLLMYHAFSLAKQDQMMSVASVLVTKWVRFNFDVLMYRKEPWDDDLVMANELLARLPDVVVDHWKRWTTLKWMILDIHSEPANQDRFIIEAEVFLESQIHRLEAEMVTSGKPYWMTYGGRRFGRDLLCLLNDAKDLGSERAIAVLRRYGRRFCPSAEAGSGKVYDAICQWFVELEMWEEIAKLPSDHHLDTGFQLSRSGYLIFAEQHLRSGLHTIRNGIQWPLAWRFDLELITVLVRLERWTEVSEHIENVWVVYRRMQSRLPTISMLTGDFPEFSMSLLCLQADMYLTENDLVPAALNLNRALDYGGRMRDPSIQSTCISVRSRLIKAQLNLQQFRYVVTTSLRQIGDLQQLVTRKSTNNPIQPVEEAPNSVPVLTLFQTSRALEVAQRSAVEDLVVCVDELCDHQAFAAASEILRYLPGTTILLKSPLPEYLEQRIAQQKSRIGRKLVERIPHADHMIATTTRANEKGKSVAPFTTTIPSINMQSPSPIQATKVQNIASLEENGQQTMMSLIKNRKARERRHREEQEMTPRIGAGRPRKAWEYKHRKERSRVADDVEQLRLRKGVTNADKGRAALQQTGREPQDQDNSISPLKGYTSEIHATEYLKPLLFFESPSSEISSTLASSSRYQKEKGQSPPSPLFGTSSTYDDPKGLSPPNTLIRLSPTYDEEKGQPSSKTSTGKNITKIPATPQWWHPMPQKMWMRRLLRLKAPSTIPRARVEIQSEKSETQSGETFPTAELTLL